MGNKDILYNKDTFEPAEAINPDIDGFAIEQPDAGGDRKQKWLFLGVLRDWLADFFSKNVDSIVALEALTGTKDGQVIKMTGYYAGVPLADMPDYIVDVDSVLAPNRGSVIARSEGGCFVWGDIEDVNPLFFGCDPTGITSNTEEIQFMINAGFNIVGEGTYLLDSSVTLVSNTTLKGTAGAYSLHFKSNNDIELFNSVPTESNIINTIIDNVFLEKTVSGLTTKYELHLYNPSITTIRNTRVKSGHVDSQYSDVNVGGIWLERNGFGGASFLNHITDSWIQNNSIKFTNITDATITGTYVWGHTREFTIGLFGSTTGAIDISGNPGIICSKFLGGIYFGAVGINQIRIMNNEFDGNPLLELGRGIYMAFLVTQSMITGNTFWGCGDHAIHAKDPVGLVINGNNFWKNNGNDNFQDDIRIEGVTFTPFANVITNNTHNIDEVRNNPGYAYNEVGLASIRNLYSNNGATAENYQPRIISYSETSVGETLFHSGNSFSPQKRQKEVRGSVNPNGGTLDLDLGDNSLNSNYVGSLYVSLIRTDFTSQSRQSEFSVLITGSSGTFTIVSNASGSGGSIPWTVTLLSPGIIRLTNTSTDGGQIGTGAMFFDGIKNRV